jgi:hypothetical protein
MARAEQAFDWRNVQRKRLLVWALAAESGALDSKAWRPGLIMISRDQQSLGAAKQNARS